LSAPIPNLGALSDPDTIRSRIRRRSFGLSSKGVEIIEGKMVQVARLSPQRIGTDAEAFQFKSGGDGRGVTSRLADVKRWDATSSGKVMLYEKLDGRIVIADGHQRLGLAKRASNAGQKVAMDGYLFRAKDGWQPSEVRLVAALKNMRESSGTPVDFARIMRERPDLVRDGSIPMKDPKLQIAHGLSKLSPDAFGMVSNGLLKPSHAAIIGETVADSRLHAGLAAEMRNAGVASSQHARLFVGQAMASPVVAENTASLFGKETMARTLIRERAAVLNKSLQMLATNEKTFSVLSREASAIEAAGNKLRKKNNAALASHAAGTRALVERLATTHGPVSSLLDAAAKSVASGSSTSAAASDFVKGVDRVAKDGGIKALMSGNLTGLSGAASPGGALSSALSKVGQKGLLGVALAAGGGLAYLMSRQGAHEQVASTHQPLTHWLSRSRSGNVFTQSAPGFGKS
jgi:hypothetical protein